MSKPFQVCFAVTALSLGSLFAEGEEIVSLENQEVALSEVIALSTFKKKQEESKTCPKKNDMPAMVLLPSQPCPDNWRLSADFLYLFPTVDDTYFVLNSGSAATTPNGPRVNNDFSFTPAFRVGAEYAFCDSHREFQAFYSHLSSSQNKTVAGNNLWATVGCPDAISTFERYAGTAASSQSLLYQHLDVNFSQQILNSRELYLYIQPGIEYAYLRLNQNYTYQITGGAQAVVDQKSRTWGVGPQIGLGIDYNFYQGALSCSATQAFSITTLFSGSILTGRAKTESFESLAAATVLDVQDEHTWRVFPAMHARVGLNYLIRGDQAGGSVGIGYEFNTYSRANERLSFSDDTAEAAAVTNYYNFDVQGLYVSAAISF